MFSCPSTIASTHIVVPYFQIFSRFSKPSLLFNYLLCFIPPLPNICFNQIRSIWLLVACSISNIRPTFVIVISCYLSLSLMAGRHFAYIHSTLPAPPQNTLSQFHLQKKITVSTNNNHHTSHHKPNNHHHHNNTNHHQTTSSPPPSGAPSPTQSQNSRGGFAGITPSVSHHLSPVPSVCVRVPSSPGFDSEPPSPAKTLPIGKPNEFSTLLVRECHVHPYSLVKICPTENPYCLCPPYNMGFFVNSFYNDHAIIMYINFSDCNSIPSHKLCSPFFQSPQNTIYLQITFRLSCCLLL